MGSCWSSPETRGTPQASQTRRTDQRRRRRPRRPPPTIIRPSAQALAPWLARWHRVTGTIRFKPSVGQSSLNSGGKGPRHDDEVGGRPAGGPTTTPAGGLALAQRHSDNGTIAAAEGACSRPTSRAGFQSGSECGGTAPHDADHRAADPERKETETGNRELAKATDGYCRAPPGLPGSAFGRGRQEARDRGWSSDSAEVVSAQGLRAKGDVDSPFR